MPRLPPAPSHIRHFHWLGDVRNYRSRMVRGGATEPIALLDDPRNEVRPTAEELHAPSPWTGGAARRLLRYALEEAMLRSSRLRGWGRRTAARFAPHRRPGRRTVGSVLYQFEQRAMQKRNLHKSLPELAARLAARLAGEANRLVVACLAGYEDHIPSLPAQNVLRLTMPQPAAQEAGFRLSNEIIEAGAAGGTLLVLAPVSLLAHWDGLGQAAERALAHFDQAILTLVQPCFAVARIQDFSWALSVLVSAFEPARFTVCIESVTLGGDRTLAARLFRLCFPSFWLRLPRRLMRYAGALLRRGLSYPLSAAETGPERFSVLLIELTRRRVDRLAAAELVRSGTG